MSRAGGANTTSLLRRISQSEIRNSAAAKNRNRKARAGKNSFPQPPSFLPARAFSFRAQAGNQSEFRSKKVRASFSNCDQFRHFSNSEAIVARSPRLRRVSLRKKPCILELNRKVGQIQIQFFGKANGGSACEARNKSLFQFFPFRQRRNIKQVFNPALLVAKGDNY